MRMLQAHCQTCRYMPIKLAQIFRKHIRSSLKQTANCFEFNSQFYQQVKGVPMGKAWAPAVASIYLAEWEAQVFQQTNIVPLLYKRYIDDILCILPSRQSAETLLHCMRNLDSNIRISEFTVGSAGHFLDVNIKIEHRQIVTTLYKKPTHLQVLLHYQSAHSTSLKLNIAFCN